MLVAMAAAVAGMATLSVIGVASASYDMGPSFGADYGGGDYNCTMWNTPESGAANNYEVAALACEQHCLADEMCCAWTYCPPGSDGVPKHERCCLKGHVPSELHGTQHWTGLVPRAVTDRTNKTLSKQCQAAVPEYHFYPAAVESQDASGTSFVNGRWHVFPDCIPIDNPNKTSLHWCHFSSLDLVHWEEHPVALTPDQPYDTPVIDTGSVAVLPNGTAFAIYATGNTTSILPDGPYDGAICIAVAEDAMLIKWRKLGPVIDNPTPNLFPGMMARYGFRDPTTPWLAPCPAGGTGECWHVVLGSGGVVDKNGTGESAGLLYTSKSSVDIESWTFGGILFRDAADDYTYGQYQYSCPDFFPLPLSPGQDPQDRTWVWMYLNPFFSTYLAPHSNKYFVGKLINNSRFVPNTATAQNAGSFGHTIAKVASGQGRNLLWGSVALDLAAIPNYLDRGTAHAFGVMSLPKAISSTASGMLGFSFVPELEVLRDVSSAYHASNLPENTTFGIKGLQLELLVTFELSATSTAANASSTSSARNAFGVRFFSGEHCVVDVGYDPSTHELYISRSSGGVGHQTIAVPHTLADGEALQMHLFLDGPILEVIGNGRSPSEAQVWPVPASMDVRVFGPRGVSTATAWRLRSIHV